MSNQKHCHPSCRAKKTFSVLKTCESCKVEFLCGRVDKRVCGKKECLAFLQKSRAYTWRLRYFGMTDEHYKEMFLKQNGLCQICKMPETYLHKGVLQNLSVDHDHSTGKVRGLLCKKCNHGLGFFNDNIETMKSAIEYILESRIC